MTTTRLGVLVISAVSSCLGVIGGMGIDNRGVGSGFGVGRVHMVDYGRELVVQRDGSTR